MRKLVVATILVAVVSFTAWKKLQSLTFTVQLKDKGTIKVANLVFTPHAGVEQIDSVEEFSLYNDIGHFNVRKDLEDVKSIEVIDDSGESLKVTYRSGLVLQGNRRPLPNDVPSDFLEGQCGKQIVSLPLRKVASITRD